MTTPVVRRVDANGIQINVALAGTGPAVLLLHGFPHTWQVGSEVIPELARTHRVIAPDLRGLGGTTRADDGYDVTTLTADAVALLDALDEPAGDVVGLDLGVAPAFLLALRHPQRVRRLVVMEALLGRLPGAENFLANGPPWWFGFHAVPGLAERVLTGHEAEYIDFFLRYIGRPRRHPVRTGGVRPGLHRCGITAVRVRALPGPGRRGQPARRRRCRRPADRTHDGDRGPARR